MDGWMMPRHKILGLVIDALGMHKKTQKKFVSGQHQDVFGHCQTHLSWAIGQLKEKRSRQ
jgi:hypothetical protein